MNKKVINFSYIFPDLVQREFHTASANTVWALDFTHLTVKVEEAPGTFYKLLVVIDHATGEVLAHKVYKSKSPKGATKASAAVAFLKRTIKKHEPYIVKLIVHTDRGPEFVSKAWHNYCEASTLIEGSMSAANSPTSNAVVERWFKLFKTDLQNNTSMPATVATELKLKQCIAARIKYLNSGRVTNRSAGLPPTQLRQKYEMIAMHVQPTDAKSTSFHLDAKTKAITAHKQAVADYHQDSDSQKLQDVIKQQQLLGTMFVQATNIVQAAIVDQISPLDEKLNALQDQMATVVAAVSPKVKAKRVPARIRAELYQEVFQAILVSKPAFRQKLEPHSRFVVASLVCYYTGMRLNEAGSVTKEQYQELITTAKLTVLRSKTLDYHHYVASRNVIEVAKSITVHANRVFLLGDTIKGNMHPSNFLHSINNWLARITKDSTEHSTSHSFRIGYINRLLRAHIPVEKVSKIIGHKSISATQPYLRVNILDKETLESIDKSS
jgi:transposase InsO family protein/integrase